jgi:hypothetical protein
MNWIAPNSDIPVCDWNGAESHFEDTTPHTAMILHAFSFHVMLCCVYQYMFFLLAHKMLQEER